MVGRELWTRLGDSIAVSFMNVVSGVSGVSDRKYGYQLFNATMRHPNSETYTYLWPIQLLIDDFAFYMRRNVDLLCAPFTMTRQNLTLESEVGKQSDFFFRWSEGSWIRVVIDAI